MTPQAQQAADYAVRRLVAHGISPMYAVAAVGHLIEESGGFDPSVIAGDRRGDQGSAGFVAQWRGDRLQNLIDYARSQGRPLDLATQLDFIVHEGRAGLDQGAARWYRQATTGQGNFQDAVAAFSHFERPQGYSATNPGGIATFDRRMSHAVQIARNMGAPGQSMTQPTGRAPVRQNPYLAMNPFGSPAGAPQPYTSRGPSPVFVGPVQQYDQRGPSPMFSGPLQQYEQRGPMPAFDWSSHRSGGGTREDAILGLDPSFRASLERMIASAPPEIRQGLSVGSGYRSEQRQAELWEEALRKYGSPEAARKWVAPPGRSRHNHGQAVDIHWNGMRLDRAPSEVQQWVHDAAGQHGLSFPLDNEPWHLEPAGARNADNPSHDYPFGVAGQGGSVAQEGQPYGWQDPSSSVPNSQSAPLFGQDLYQPLDIDYGEYGIETPAVATAQFNPPAELGFNPYNIDTFSRGNF